MKPRRDDILSLEAKLFADFIEGDGAVTARVLGRPQGYVYLLRGSRGFKIGKSKQPMARVRALRTGSADTIKVVATIFALDYERLESILHLKFRPKRIRAEWFDLDDSDVAFICSLDQTSIDALIEKTEPNQRSQRNASTMSFPTSVSGVRRG